MYVPHPHPHPQEKKFVKYFYFDIFAVSIPPTSCLTINKSIHLYTFYF